MKILLVVNSDPTELGITMPLAQQFKQRLEKRGFVVRIEPIPKEKTWMHWAKKEQQSGKALDDALHSIIREQIKDISTRFEDWHIFDLHTAPHDTLIRKPVKPAR